MDRAGLVGADGATHCGAFDVAYMACLPNIVCMAPSNEAELINMVATAAAIDDRCVVAGDAKGLDSFVPLLRNALIFSPSTHLMKHTVLAIQPVLAFRAGLRVSAFLVATALESTWPVRA